MVTRGLYFDSATLYYRAFFAVPDSVKAPDGNPSGAVRGFLDMVATIIKQFPADHVVFAWDDDWRPQWRVDLVPSYKTHRLEPDARISGGESEDVPDALGPQISAIAQILDAIGVQRLGESGFEADDILGSLVAQHKISADVVTGDRDLFQLVNDTSGARVISITKGVRNLQIVNDAYLLEKYGVRGSQYADFATLRGDASDGLPGIRGIGEKTASALIATCGSIDALMMALADNPDEFPVGVQKKFSEQQGNLARFSQVVKVREDSTVTKNLGKCEAIADESELRALCAAWGVSRQVNQVLKALGLAELDSVD